MSVLAKLLRAEIGVQVRFVSYNRLTKHATFEVGGERFSLKAGESAEITAIGEHRRTSLDDPTKGLELEGWGT